MKLTCRKCGVDTAEEDAFCANCRHRLFPHSRYDLTTEDFAYAPDQDAIEMIKATGVLPYLVKYIALAEAERKLLSQLSPEARRIADGSKVDSIVRRAAVALCVDTLPKVLIVPSGRPNAFTFGSENNAYIVVDAALLDLLTQSELAALLAHELGHVKSGHMLYHSVAELLGSGISASASFLGLNLVSIPVRLAILSWHRESEVTADRTSLLALSDINAFESFMIKLAHWSSFGELSSTQSNVERTSPSTLESAAELFRTHPLHANRLRLAHEFSQSEQYLAARKKIETRLRLLRALVPVCRSCSLAKLTEELFCPRCGKSQI